MRGCIVVVTACVAVLHAAPGCLAGSLDFPSSESSSPGIEATSGLMSSDLSTPKAQNPGSSREEANEIADEAHTGKLTILLNDPSQLAAAPGSAASVAAADPVLPGTATAGGRLTPGPLPGDLQNSVESSSDQPIGSDDGHGNRGHKPSAGGAPGAVTTPVAKEGPTLAPPINPTAALPGGAEAFNIGPAKPNSPARRAPIRSRGRTAGRWYGSAAQPTGAAVRSCFSTLCLFGLAAIPLTAWRRRRGLA